MSETPATSLEPTIIVIFGITGDLSQRYLLPSLYHLFQEKILDGNTQILGLTRQDMTANDLYDKVELCINEVDNLCDPVALKAIRTQTELLQFDPEKPEDYPKLLEKLNAIEAEHGVCMNRLYYLSIPPKLFETTVSNLATAGLNQSCPHGVAKTRLLVEKPFGHDLASAQQLIDHTNAAFQEEQVFRIDHYLAKETIQNILVFRAHNPMIADIWSRQYINSIDILVSEKIGIENRVSFYEGLGALRDFVQSHMMQMLGIVTMELPHELTSDTIHAAKQTLLDAVQPADPAQTVRGQYDTYKEEVSNPDSTTETFVSLHLSIDNDRWRDVPITLTTGKALLDARRSEITVTFHSPEDKVANALTFRVQPNEGIHFDLQVKKPGYDEQLEKAMLDFSYQEAFGVNSNHPSAYERVLVDAIKGDRTLFATSAEVLASWRILEPIIQAWQGNADGMQTYATGSDGPLPNLVQ